MGVSITFGVGVSPEYAVAIAVGLLAPLVNSSARARSERLAQSTAASREACGELLYGSVTFVRQLGLARVASETQPKESRKVVELALKQLLEDMQGMDRAAAILWVSGKDDIFQNANTLMLKCGEAMDITLRLIATERVAEWSEEEATQWAAALKPIQSSRKLLAAAVRRDLKLAVSDFFIEQTAVPDNPEG